MISYNCRKLIVVPLIIFGLIVVPGIRDTAAALLKDVRIGEYIGFTRVVFELNSPGQPPQIQPQSNGLLTIGFENTQPDLVRKIPVERSEHVRELKFWHRDRRLSITLQFDFDHFRFETFPLQKPPRIAVDIHPLTAKPVLEDEIVSPADLDARTVSNPPAVQAATGSPDTPVTQSATSTPASVQPPQAPVAPQSDSPTAPPPDKPRYIGTEAAETGVPETAAVNPPRATGAVASAPAADASPTDRTHPKSNRLQFYLVITLVVITIVMLALLLLMLLSRHRWTGDKDGADVNEYLKNQDERIASLNARIQEQFRRYEEA